MGALSFPAVAKNGDRPGARFGGGVSVGALFPEDAAAHGIRGQDFLTAEPPKN